MTRSIELLAPAKDAETAVQAILHGADAVYIGPEGFGARKAAANSLDEIRRVVEFAHPYRARVYATVNTIYYDRERRAVERLVGDLYRIGVDAIIVQDMGLLRLDLPPIALHASTQCDTRTTAKARFLEDVGFSQIVLARELSLREIGEVCREVTVPVEAFVHGALCVSYSGRCHISQACSGRSANRGECAQYCRMPYTLRDAAGGVLARNKYLLSLRDFNASGRVADLLRAGVSSFKIEGRLKDASYVKNVTASYRRIIDREIAAHPDLYRRASFGASEIAFEPDPQKSFNRGFSRYFLDERRPARLASLDTPKSLGEPVRDLSALNNGDGLSFIDTRTGEYSGFRINRVEPGAIVTSANERIPFPRLRAIAPSLRRTYDRVFDRELSRPTAERRIAVDVTLTETFALAEDERGVRAAVPFDAPKSPARKPLDPEPAFAKLGGTPYVLRRFDNRLDPSTFVPASALTSVRRSLFEALDRAAQASYPFDYRRPERMDARVPEYAGWRENIANADAARFYGEHGVEPADRALEVTSELKPGDTLMTCRHCILRELGKCLRTPQGRGVRLPLTISTGDNTFGLRFDCDRCEMRVTAQ